jgi:hypothetical protein
LTDNDLADSPYPHFRHPIPRAGLGPLTLLGDAAHARCRPTPRRGPTRRCSTRWCCARRWISGEQRTAVTCRKRCAGMRREAAQRHGGVRVTSRGVP